jgi:transcriptional regulator with XRE-family HTH domain
MTDSAAADPAHAAVLQELVRMRTQAGLSPRDLADRLGVEEGAVVRAEAGACRVEVMALQRWAFACGSTLAEVGRRLNAAVRH